MKEIKLEHLDELLEEYEQDLSCRVARHALSNQDISVASASKDTVAQMDFNFDIDIKTAAVNNQKASGRLIGCFFHNEFFEF